ncbi:MAG TPA: helix-turn-helix domain-containing protein [Chloroflexota bacterium]|nr:helix-turn-helix domain-containing protein [Chloroflexota bacterium]
MAASTRPPRPRSEVPERWSDRTPPGTGPNGAPRDPENEHRRGAENGVPAHSGEPRSPGERLRAARLRRKISLIEAEQATRIRARYLQALEEDEYAALPSGVYSRGFLRNYAIYLGVPPDEIMAAIPKGRRRERRPGVRSVAPPIKVSAPRSIWLIAAAAAGVLVLAALIWLGLSAPEPRSPTGAAPGDGGTPPQATGASGTPGTGSLVQLPPLPTGGPTAGPSPAPPSAPPTATVPVQGVNVELRTLDRVWVRATVDGRVVNEETYAAGQTVRWTGQQSVLLRVGNGAGVDVTYNGQRVGPLGPAGQPLDREFRR